MKEDQETIAKRTEQKIKAKRLEELAVGKLRVLNNLSALFFLIFAQVIITTIKF